MVWNRSIVLLLALLIGLGAPSGRVWSAQGADRAAEIEAREAFAAGRFEEALNRFAKLYAQTLHPVYLRNIGRCHQKMREPQKAMDAFRDYLTKGRNIPPEERLEIEAYIREMQALSEQQRREQEQERERERERAGRVTAAPNSGVPKNGAGATSTTPTATVVPGLVTAAGGGSEEVILSGGPADARDRPTPADGGEPPIYKRWWFWAAVGAVAVGTGATVFLLTRDDCPEGVICQD